MAASCGSALRSASAGLAVLVWATVAGAQTRSPVTFAWNAATNAQRYGLTVDGVETNVGAVLQSPPMPLSVGPHTATVRAYNGALVGPSTPPLVFAVFDPACVSPLGNRAVSVFPTALQKTGSGGAGSMARLDFQVASPASPIIRVVVQTGGTDLKAVSGSDLSAMAGLWFPLPATPGTYPLSVTAMNAYGCSRTQSTSYTVTVK